MTNSQWKDIADDNKKDIYKNLKVIINRAIAKAEEYKEYFKNAHLGNDFNAWKNSLVIPSLEK